MKRRQLTGTLAIALGLCTFGLAGFGAKYPAKPIQIVSAVPIGSATDILARQVAAELGAKIGGTVIVVNKPGAAGTMAADLVAKSPADGYDLLFGNSALALYPFLYKKLPFDVLKDFAGVGLVADTPYVVAVNNDLGVKNMQELIALAKAKPKALNFSSAGVGTGTHIACELLASRAGIQLTHVPYANMTLIPSDLQGNTVQMMCGPIVSFLPLLNKGRVSIIGVAAPTAMTDPIAVPSIKESTGVDFIATQWYGLFAPKQTPAPILEQIAGALKAAAGDPGFRQKLKDQGLDSHPIYLNAFDEFVVKEQQLWGPVLRDAGVQPEE